jgi:hypothetical protein
MYHRLREWDSTRFIDTASGWFRPTVSDVDSHHVYFKPVKLKRSDKPIFLSEFGGYVYRNEAHVFNPDKTYGYRIFDNRQKFEDALITLYENEVIPHIATGLCATVYTQLSDVEDETNGLLTYDRKVCKVDAAKLTQNQLAILNGNSHAAAHDDAAQMGIGVQAPPVLFLAFPLGDLHVLGAGMQILTFGFTGGDDLTQAIHQILQNELLTVEIGVIRLFLDQNRAGGMLGINNRNTVIDAAGLYQLLDLVGNVMESRTGIRLNGKCTMIGGHSVSPLL